MVAFLAEGYCRAAELAAGTPGLDILGKPSCDPVAGTLPARLVHAIYVPDDETCFYYFEAASIEAVQEAAVRAGLRFERLTEAVTAWPAPLTERSAHHYADPVPTDEGAVPSRATAGAGRFAPAP